MPIFCKQCGSRRLPIYQKEETRSLWLCEKCKNYVDAEDYIVREQTDEEIAEAKKKLEQFERTSNFPKEKLVRRKGVN
ncbi:MAG: hypothetical protein ACR2LL_13420 [Nitrosopumilus sp.]